MARSVEYLREQAKIRMRRYRLRLQGKSDGTKRVCIWCNANLSRFAPIGAFACHGCEERHGETCKHGHSKAEYAIRRKRGDGFTVVCGECRRESGRRYAQKRRARDRESAL